MSSEEPGALDQGDVDAVVEMSREDSGVRKASSAGLEARVGNQPPAGKRLQSQSSKPLVPTGRKLSSDGSASRRTSNTSAKNMPLSSAADMSHLPNIGSGRSTPSGPSATVPTPSGPSATVPTAPSPATKPRGIPKPNTQSPAHGESSPMTAGTPAKASSLDQASRPSQGFYSRLPRSEGATSAPVSENGRKSTGNDSESRAARGRGIHGGDVESRRDSSPGRDPREAGWNASPAPGSKLVAGPQVAAAAAAAVRRELKLSSPSEEERRKRVEWVREKRRREEAKAREEAERRQAEELRRREEEQARLEARRAAIRERIHKQHEVAAKMAQERAKATEAARGAIGRFLASKPLHERLKEDYEKQQAEIEAEKKRQYDEEARTKQVRPGQIIKGEVQVKPHSKPNAANSSPNAADRSPPVRSPGRNSGVGSNAGAGAGAGPDAIGSRSASGRGRVSARPSARAAEGEPFTAAPPQVPAARSGSAAGSARSAGITARNSGAAARAIDAAESGQAGRQQKVHVQGPTLTSTTAKGSRRVQNGLGSLSRRGHLVDRASSPFVFNEAGVPVNVPAPALVTATTSETLLVDGISAVAAGSSAAAAVMGMDIHMALAEGALGASANEYAGDDDVPQMQSPLGHASSGAEAAYESELAAEPEPVQGVWGSDAAETDADTPNKVLGSDAAARSQYRASRIVEQEELGEHHLQQQQQQQQPEEREEGPRAAPEEEEEEAVLAKAGVEALTAVEVEAAQEEDQDPQPGPEPEEDQDPQPAPEPEADRSAQAVDKSEEAEMEEAEQEDGEKEETYESDTEPLGAAIEDADVEGDVAVAEDAVQESAAHAKAGEEEKADQVEEAEQEEKDEQEAVDTPAEAAASDAHGVSGAKAVCEATEVDYDDKPAGGAQQGVEAAADVGHEVQERAKEANTVDDSDGDEWTRGFADRGAMVGEEDGKVADDCERSVKAADDVDGDSDQSTLEVAEMS